MVVYPQDALPESVCQKRGSGKCLEEQFDFVSPNLSIIKIKIENNALPEKNKELAYVLDTYMDLKMGIVKLQIWDLEKKAELKKHIYKLYKQSKIIKDSNKTKNDIAKPNNLKDLLRKINNYGVKNDTLSELIKEVTDGLNSNLSQETLTKVFALTKGKTITSELLLEVVKLCK